jgi:hypothetical protein
VTEDKLYLFLEQEVINRESRACGAQGKKAKRIEVYKEGERAKKRLRGDDGGEEKWDKEALDAQFSETVRYAVINSYASAITELYGWQFDSKAPPPPPIRGAKLSAVLESVRRDEDTRRRVNFVDRGLFTITAGYDIKGLKRAITWC